MDDEMKMALDIRRSIVLGNYIKHWGIPDFRFTGRKADDLVEIYSFPPRDNGAVHRIASVGISAIGQKSNQSRSWELFMTLPRGLGGETFERVGSFLLDLAAYSLRDDVNFRMGEVISETHLMPSGWPPKAILLDEPRGEPEELVEFHVASQHIDLIWVVPIYTDEYNLIKEEGLDAFDALEERAEWSLADINRTSVIQPSGINN